MQNQAKAVGREFVAILFDESEPYGFRHSLRPMAFMPSLAREDGCGLRTLGVRVLSLGCSSPPSGCDFHVEVVRSLGQGTRFLSDTTSVSRYAVTRLLSVERPAPKSDATFLRVSPLLSAIRTPSARNPFVRFNSIGRLLCWNKCY